MKIALITEDGQSISRHFGRAPYYLVVTVDNGQVVHREIREKLGHKHFASQEHHEHHDGENHGVDDASHNRHVNMAQAISDCEVVICGGMGAGAYESMKRLNIKPVVTELHQVDAAVKAYLSGTLVDRTDLLH